MQAKFRPGHDREGTLRATDQAGKVNGLRVH